MLCCSHWPKSNLFAWSLHDYQKVYNSKLPSINMLLACLIAPSKWLGWLSCHWRRELYIDWCKNKGSFSVHQASFGCTHALTKSTGFRLFLDIWGKQHLIEDPTSSYRWILFLILLLDTLINLPACWDQSVSAVLFIHLRPAIHLMAARRTLCNWI